MDACDIIADFVAHPYPIWNNSLSSRLAGDYFNQHSNNYTLTACILKQNQAKEATINLTGDFDPIVIVLPSDEIQFFFDEHGLNPFPASYLFEDAISQVKQAVNVFDDVPAIKTFIRIILKSIVILKAEDPDTDVSYSHPDLPFSIFVSVCDQLTQVTSLRIAESVLHETMHLLLTLIESVSPMIVPGSKETFYSPWRDENRPVRGVLHGLFVFKAVWDFYCALKVSLVDNVVLKFIDDRIDAIEKEIEQISGFQNSSGLTPQGQKLAGNLLSNNR